MSWAIIKLTSRVRFIASFILVITALGFVFMPSIFYDETAKNVGERTAAQLIKVGELIGLFLAFISIWLWKKELGLGTLGPLGEGSISTQDEYDISKKSRELVSEIDSGKLLEMTANEMNKKKVEDRKAHIISLIKKKHAVSIATVANELCITKNTTEILLFSLMKEGLIRCDGFPRRSIYTLMSSLENQAIDWVKAMVEKDNKIINERRFVRINNQYELDAIFETDKMLFLIEIKNLNQWADVTRFPYLVKHIYNVAATFQNDLITAILVVIVETPSDVEKVNSISQKITDESEKISIRIIPVLRQDIK